jgi:hypothetical protein
MGKLREPGCMEDPYLHTMLTILKSKADPKSRFTYASVWTAWKGWEFG